MAVRKILIQAHKQAQFEAQGFKKVGEARGGSIHMEKEIVEEKKKAK